MISKLYTINLCESINIVSIPTLDYVIFYLLKLNHLINSQKLFDDIHWIGNGHYHLFKFGVNGS